MRIFLDTLTVQQDQGPTQSKVVRLMEFWRDEIEPLLASKNIDLIEACHPDAVLILQMLPQYTIHSLAEGAVGCILFNESEIPVFLGQAGWPRCGIFLMANGNKEVTVEFKF